MPCPYLSGRVEQQLFAELSGAKALDVFDALSQGGFRRSHHIIYKPACTGCTACVPVRIPVARFKSSRAWRKINNRNADLTVVDVGTRITEEQYELFQSYTNRRHGDGEMAKMSRRDYAAMVLSSPVDTVLVEFRNGNGKLIAVCLMDRLAGGLLQEALERVGADHAVGRVAQERLAVARHGERGRRASAEASGRAISTPAPIAVTVEPV